MERLALFENEVARLEAVRIRFARQRPLYDKGFLALFLAGIACFAFGRFVGLWGILCTGMVGSAGFGMVRRRSAELSAEVESLRREIRRMRDRAGTVP